MAVTFSLFLIFSPCQFPLFPFGSGSPREGTGSAHRRQGCRPKVRRKARGAPGMMLLLPCDVAK